jgi:TolB-like protein/DNA-binding winged helix-turn-helix (wHTH) protein/tetratricopeptide (TPR) repeat protein
MVVQISKAYLLAEYQLEPDKRILFRNGEAIHLAHRPFQVLLYLLENRDRVVTRQELFEQFWDGKDVYDDALRKCVGAIRKAFDDSSEQPRFIETRYREGYRYIGPVEEQVSPNLPPVVEVERTRSVKIRFEEELQDATATPAVTAVTTLKTLPQTKTKPSRRVIAGSAVVMVALLGTLAWVIAHSKSSRNAASNSTLPIRSIAVLPLKNLTGDAGQDYFSDGVTESFITELSKIDGLKVISRNSVFTFKDKEIDPREAGKRLDVAAILEGSVRRNNDVVRVDVRLVNTQDGSIIWASDSYNRTLKDILAVQDEIACSVTASLRLRLCGDGNTKRDTNNVEAYQAYLKGLYHFNKETAADIRKAQDYFEQAIAVDPNYALAWARYADSFLASIWLIPVSSQEAVPKAKAAAQRALAIDDTLALAHNVMALVYYAEWDWGNYRKELDRAIALDSNWAEARSLNAYRYVDEGKFDEAWREIKRAEELDPLSLSIKGVIGNILYAARRYDELLAFCNTLPEDPNCLPQVPRGLAYLQLGRYEEAIREFEEARRLLPGDWRRLEELASAYALAGKMTEAKKFLQELQSRARREYIPPSSFGRIYTAFGDKTTAFRWLERAITERDFVIGNPVIEPRYDALRADPRFASIVRGFGAY